MEHHCPQCGAPVFLDEADRYFACPYCRVKSCIAQKGFGRYFLTPAGDLTQDLELIFLPYWRFKGVRYACSFEGVDHWFMDLSFLALPGPAGPVPFSLGFRTQALPLRRVSVRTRGRFVRPVPFGESLARAAGLSPKGKRMKDALIREEIGETLSLIYAPYYLKGEHLYDGVLNSPLGKAKDGDAAYRDMELCRPERETRLLSGVCPGCGWDLEGQSDSLVLICRNCDSLWQPRDDRLGRIRYGAATPGHPDDVLVPFWKISAQITGVTLDTKDDLLRMANLPWSGQSKSESLAFWAPAFKIRPKVFLRLSRHLTLAQPGPDLQRRIPDNAHLPITLPASEAVQSIRLTLASIARPVKDFLPQLAGARIDPWTVSLVFLPFEAHSHELIHRETNLAVNTNVLKLAGNL